VWGYSTGKGKSSSDTIAYKHPAIFPESLARDHILSWSNEGHIVLDPFMGSGTTAKAALEANRSFIGFEISEFYVEIANYRLGIVQPIMNIR
jgi:site-specific DNA-methyltransferase (adenine-specific)